MQSKKRGVKKEQNIKFKRKFQNSKMMKKLVKRSDPQVEDNPVDNDSTLLRSRDLMLNCQVMSPTKTTPFLANLVGKVLLKDEGIPNST